MSSTFGDSTMGLTYRRVQVVGVNEDGTEVQVADSTGWRTHLDGTVRPKGTGLPTEGEVWLIERLDATHWILRAQIASAEVDLGSEVNSIVAAEVAQQLAAEAAEDAERAAQEAALAAGIMDGTGVVLIQDAAPGTEHENASTLWIDTTNGLNRPMRWSGDQWVVVVDRTAMEAARAAVEARDAAQSAADLAQSAKDTADAAKDAADAAVAEAEAALLEAAGKGRIIYGDPLTTPGEANSLLIGPGNILYYWDSQAWVEATHEQMFMLRDELDALVGQVDANITALADVQDDLVGVVGQIDGKSTIWPIGSSPDLGVDDTGDLRLLVDGGVEYWDGYEWLPADPRVAAAVNEAAEALGLANTKSTTYYKATEPINAQRPAGDIEAPETAFSTNDLWLRTGDNRLHRWDGEAWLEVRDSSISVIEGQVSDLGQSLTGLEGRVDGKSTIYIQDTAPVDVAGTEDIGDLWIDTAGGGRVYKVWDGEEWVLSDDPRVAEVLDQVSRKITTYYGSTEPTGTVQYPLVEGDLWLRSPDNRTFRYNGADWVEVSDSRIHATEQTLATVQGELIEMNGRIDGKAVVWYQDTDPSAGATPAWDIAQKGDIWIDISDPGAILYKVWDSNSWETITDPAALAALAQVDTKIVTYFAAGTTTPTGAGFPPAEGYTTGDLWIRASDSRMFRFDGTNWVDATYVDPRVGEQALEITSLQEDLGGLSGTVDGKAVIWYQEDAPTGLGEGDAGDIWIDSNAVPKKFQSWSGTGWVDITDQGAIDALEQVSTRTTTYFASGTTAPSVTPPAQGFVVGDLWVRASDKKVHRYDGSNWVDVTYVDPEVAAHASAIQTLQEDYSTLSGTVDGKAVVYVQDTDPRGGTTWGTDQKGDIWIDTAGGTTVYKVWSGSTWTTITDPTALEALEGLDSKTTTYYATGTTSPTGQSGPFVPGDLWVHTTTKQMFRYDGANWVDVTYLDSRIDDAVTQYVVQYAVNSSETVAPTTGWSTSTPTRTPGSYIWFRAQITYADGDTDTTSPALLTGNDGSTGATLYTWVKYAPNGDPTSAQMSESPEGMTHMGIAPNQTTPTEGTDPSVYTWSLIKGADGNDGKGITTTTVHYTVSSSGTTTPTSGWETSPIPSTSPGQFLWTRTTTSYTDGSSTPAYSVAKHGSTGTAGVGISGTSVTYQTSSSGTLTPGGTWQDDPTPTAPGQYLWTRTVTTYTDSSTSTAYAVAAHGTDGVDGDDGRGITGTTVTYQVGSSGTNAPTGGWSSTVPPTSPGQYLWTRTVTSFTDGTTSDPAYSVARHGTTGATGVGVSGTQVRYQVGTSGTNEPTGTWVEDPPATSPGQYLWTRTITSYTDSSTSTAYAVAAHGIDGINGTDGVGIESTSVTYQVSSSGTTTPTGTWVEDPPATNPGQYLWSRTLITYTDDTTSTVYSVGAHGKDGLDAPVISLAATAQVLTAPATGGATTPTSASVVATAANTTITSWTYSVNGGSWSSTAPAGVSRNGSTVTVTGSTMTARTVAIKAADASGVSDTLTVAKVSDGAVGGDGADAYTVLLTNEAHTFAGSVSAAVAGSVKTTVLVYKGSTPQSVDITGITGQVTGLSASVDTGTDNTTSPDITVAATTSLTATSGTLTISFTADGQSFSKNFSWSVSRTGAKGDTGVSVSSVTPYYRQQPAADPAPAKPTGSTPTGWSTTEPAYAANTALYRTERVVYSNDSVAYTTVVKVSAYSGIVDLQTQYADLDGRVDGRTTIYYQDNAPTGLTTEDKGDIWVDSNASPKTYQVWSGGGWVDVTDTTAIEALGKVNTKITTYYATGTSAPSVTPVSGGFVEGDLWVHTTTKALRRYDGSNWVDITDVRVTNADNVIGAYQGTLTELSGRVDGRATVYVQDTDPRGGTTWGSDETGDIWIDTSGTTTVYKVYDGQDWEVITDPVATQALSTVTTKVTTYYKATAPITSDIKAPETAFREGDLWIRTTDNRLHRRDASGNWVEVSDTRISTLATSLATTQGELTTLEGRVDGKANVYYGGTKPTTDADGNPLSSNDQGDIWIDTSGGQTRYYVWPGTGDWTLITDPEAQAALSGLDGKVTTYYATEKTGPAPSITTPSGGFTTGDLWVNQSKGNAIYRYPGSGTAWTLLALGKEAISASARDLGGLEIVASVDAPSSPKVGDLWIDLNGNRLKRWDGIGWVEYRDPGIQSAITAAGDAQGTADSKVRVFTQTTAPTGLLPEDVGDIWINPAEDNRVYLWEQGTSTTQVGQIDGWNYATNPQANGSSGANWASYASGGSAQFAMTPTGGLALGFSSETFAQVTSSYPGTVGLRAWVDPARASGKTISVSVKVRSTITTNVTLRLKYLSGSLMMNGPSTSVWVTANTTTTVTLNNVSVPATTLLEATVGHEANLGITANVKASDLMVNPGTVVEPFWSGETPDTPSVQYDWASSPHKSHSTRRPIVVVPAGYQWTPRPPGTNAFSPGSLDAGAVLHEGTITAELFEAVLVLASRFVAGDEHGAAAELDSEGLRVYIADQDSGARLDHPMISLGDQGEHALAVTNGIEPTALASMSAEGLVTGVAANFQQDIVVGGNMLMGVWANRETDLSGDRSSIFWNMPWGIVGDHVDVSVIAAANGYLNGITTRQMLAYHTWTMLAGRTYRVHLQNASVNAMNHTDPAYAEVRLHGTATSGDDPRGQTPIIPITASPTMAYRRLYFNAGTANVYRQYVDVENTIRGGRNVYQSIGVSLLGYNCSLDMVNDGYSWRLYVEDIGPATVQSGGGYVPVSTPAVPAPAPTLKKYTYYFYPTYTQMKQINIDSWFTFNGINQQTKQNLMQGRHSVYDTGVYRTLMNFANAYSSSGSSEVGILLKDAISGAKTVEAKVRTTLAWSPRASVKPRFGWQIGHTFSSNTSPGSDVTGSSVSPGGTTTTALGEAFGTWIKANASNTSWRLFLGPGSYTSNVDEGLFYGLGGSSTQDIRLQVDVWKY